MSAWDETPSPPPYKTKPFEEVLADFAAETGRPLWPFTRVTPSAQGKRGGDASAAMWEAWREAS